MLACLGENFFPVAYNHVCTLDTVTGNLAVKSVFITIKSEIRNSFTFFFFHFFEITVSFTMVIKRSPDGESAGGGRSTLKSTCVQFRREL